MVRCPTGTGPSTQIPLVPHTRVIGSGNCLSHVRHQAFAWINAGLWLIRLLGTSFSEIWIVILLFSFKKMHLKILSAKMAVVLSGEGEWRQVIGPMMTLFTHKLWDHYATMHPLCALYVFSTSFAAVPISETVYEFIITILIVSPNLNQYWFIANCTHRNKFHWNLNRYLSFTYSFKKMHFHVIAIYWFIIFNATMIAILGQDTNCQNHGVKRLYVWMFCPSGQTHKHWCSTEKWT